MDARNQDPYNTITIFRNAAFSLPVFFETNQLYVADTSGYSFAFIIAPTKADGSFGVPVITKLNPPIASGWSIYELSKDETASLVYGTAYSYSVMHKPPQNDPVVDQIGRVKIVDSPVFPT